MANGDGGASQQPFHPYPDFKQPAVGGKDEDDELDDKYNSKSSLPLTTEPTGPSS